VSLSLFVAAYVTPRSFFFFFASAYIHIHLSIVLRSLFLFKSTPSSHVFAAPYFVTCSSSHFFTDHSHFSLYLLKHTPVLCSLSSSRAIPLFFSLNTCQQTLQRVLKVPGIVPGYELDYVCAGHRPVSGCPEHYSQPLNSMKGINNDQLLKKD
jgi:hypothetical protein